MSCNVDKSLQTLVAREMQSRRDGLRLIAFKHINAMQRQVDDLPDNVHKRMTSYASKYKQPTPPRAARVLPQGIAALAAEIAIVPQVQRAVEVLVGSGQPPEAGSARQASTRQTLFGRHLPGCAWRMVQGCLCWDD